MDEILARGTVWRDCGHGAGEAVELWVVFGSHYVNRGDPSGLKWTPRPFALGAVEASLHNVSLVHGVRLHLWQLFMRLPTGSNGVALNGSAARQASSRGMVQGCAKSGY